MLVYPLRASPLRSLFLALIGVPLRFSPCLVPFDNLIIACTHADVKHIHMPNLTNYIIYDLCILHMYMRITLCYNISN